MYNRMKKMSNHAYLTDKLLEYKNNEKKTWQILNSIIGRTHNKSGVTDMFHVNNQNIRNPKVVAD
jgi:hypothetical protein